MILFKAVAIVVACCSAIALGGCSSAPKHQSSAPPNTTLAVPPTSSAVTTPASETPSLSTPPPLWSMKQTCTALHNSGDLDSALGLTLVAGSFTPDDVGKIDDVVTSLDAVAGQAPPSMSDALAEVTTALQGLKDAIVEQQGATADVSGIDNGAMALNKLCLAHHYPKPSEDADNS